MFVVAMTKYCVVVYSVKFISVKNLFRRLFNEIFVCLVKNSLKYINNAFPSIQTCQHIKLVSFQNLLNSCFQVPHINHSYLLSNACCHSDLAPKYSDRG